MKRRRLMKAGWMLVAAAVFPAAAGCASAAAMKKADMEAVKSKYQGARMFIRSSMNYGRFYGDRRCYLISTRRFGDLRQVEDLDEKPITPGSEMGVIPAGREVIIDRVEFPPAPRPLFSPRFYPWVFMRIDKTFTDSPHILVIQPEPKSPAEFDQILGLSLSASSPRPSIDQRPPAIRNAIDGKALLEGMEPPDVVASWGFPDQKIMAGGGVEKWSYPPRCVILKDGKFASVNDGPCR
jgi:hypothetical protein